MIPSMNTDITLRLLIGWWNVSLKDNVCTLIFMSYRDYKWHKFNL